jgi:hypothetical protein
MLSDLAAGLGAGLLYGLVGTALMVLGFLLLDVLLPGPLRAQIWTERNGNAALVLAAGLLGVGGIVTTAIATSEDDLGDGLLSTAGYGLLGLLLMGLSFVLVDLLTPGRLGGMLADAAPHPAAWVTAATNLSIAAIVAASIA